MSEADILSRFLAGEPAACRRVEDWVRRVVAFKGYYIPADDRDDVVQDCLKSLWGALSPADRPPPDSFSGFVRRVAHRRCVDWLRALRPTTELSESVADPRPDPYEQLLREDPAARVRWLLQNLDARCRELFRLHYLEKMGFREIAERLGTQESTQRVHMHNCTRRARGLAARWEPSAGL
jgi:RNA polymerase sigma-70 factor (ECF subfamily)